MTLELVSSLTSEHRVSNTLLFDILCSRCIIIRSIGGVFFIETWLQFIKDLN